jgi:plastocyanin
VLIVAALSLAALPLAGCGSSSSSSSTTEASGSEGGGQRTIAGVEANDHGTKQVEDSGKTEVELDDFYFEPTVLEGEPGQTVTLELKNEGQNEHTFTVDSLDVDVEVQPGDETEVDITIPKSGAVSFYCQFHKNMGMAGAFAVKGGSGGMTGTGEDHGGTTTDDGGGYDGY